MKYQEKADVNLLNKCNNFIIQNGNTKGNYQIFREALSLCTELIDNLLLSQKDFDDAVKAELEKMPADKEGPEMDAFVYKFNNTELVLELDVNAHKILDQLELIEKNNRV